MRTGPSCIRSRAVYVAKIPSLGRLKVHPSSYLNKKGKVQFYQSLFWGVNEFTGLILEQWVKAMAGAGVTLKQPYWDIQQ